MSGDPNSEYELALSDVDSIARRIEGITGKRPKVTDYEKEFRESFARLQPLVSRLALVVLTFIFGCSSQHDQQARYKWDVGTVTIVLKSESGCVYVADGVTYGASGGSHIESAVVKDRGNGVWLATVPVGVSRMEVNVSSRCYSAEITNRVCRITVKRDYVDREGEQSG